MKIDVVFPLLKRNEVALETGAAFGK